MVAVVLVALLAAPMAPVGFAAHPTPSTPRSPVAAAGGAPAGTGAVAPPPRSVLAPRPSSNGSSTAVIANWTELFSGGTGVSPPPRQSGEMVYDPLAGEYVLFGGESGGLARGDTWFFSDGNWSKLPSNAIAPAARWYFGMTYDAYDQCVVLFGGRNGATDFNDTWTFNGTNWTLVNASGAPPPLTTGRLVYDAADQYVLLFGGDSIMPGTPGYYNSTWSYRAGNWTNLTASVTNSPGNPNGLTFATYDTTDGFVLFYGGSASGGGNCTGAGYEGSTWTYRHGAYTNLTGNLSVAPPVGAGSRMMADAPFLGGVVLYGGWASVGCGSFANDTWAFTDGRWIDLNLRQNPGGIWDADFAADPATGSALLFSGNTVPNSFSQSTETWNLSVAFSAFVHGSPLRDIVPFDTNFSSQVYGHGPFTYAWALANGTSIGTGANASYGFTAPGVYTVNLTTTDAAGDVLHDGLSVEAYAPLTAAPLAAPFAGDAPLTVHFTAGDHGGLPPVRTVWRFGDGSSNLSADTNHTYPVRGNFSWTLNVSDSDGHDQLSAGNVTVASRFLVSVFTATPLRGIVPLPVELNLTTTGGSGPYSIAVDFADGSSPYVGGYLGGAVSVPHTYTVAGTYHGFVNVTDGNGVTRSQPFLIAVATPLTAQLVATPALGVAPLQVTFGAAAQGGFAPYTFDWSFGDGGATATGASQVFTFSAPGTYRVNLTVNDSSGLSVPASTTIDVVAPLTVNLSRSTAIGAAPLRVDFSATSAGGAAPFALNWNFGDGSPRASGAMVNHTYALVGTYHPSVSVTDHLGEQVTVPTAVEVIVPLSATLSVNTTPIVLGDSVAFTTNVVGGNAPRHYAWSGLPSGCAAVDGPRVACTPNATGNFGVGVSVSDGIGDQVAASTNLSIVAPPPVPGVVTGVVPLTWVIVGVGVGAGGVLAAWLIVGRRRQPSGGEPPPDTDPGAIDPSPEASGASEP
ncbi:MAG: PKD domain-containing protein [Thermoplasmata archaeon]|nr:PKD domain-containing protein [Thermoplasmata archaeon]